jgi:hypothetical protein
MGKLMIVCLFVSASFITQASTHNPYYEFSDAKVEILASSENPNPSEVNIHPENYGETGPGSEVGEVISIFRQIIAFGKEVYKIVENGKPVINTNYAPISVLPLGTQLGKDITPMDLSHWQSPKFMKFKVTYKNAYGAEVVTFIYNINMSSGGKFQGKGAFITNAQIVPEKVSVAWGYTFNAKMSLVGLSNLGSDEDPIAAATVQLSYSVSTIVKEDRNNMTLFITGDGIIQQL